MKHPGPWTVEGNHIVDANKKVIKAGGVNVCQYANLPVDSRQASTWANKADKLLCGVYRAHKVDIPLKDNPKAHAPRFQRMLDKLQDKEIPVISEVSAEHSVKDWNEVLERFSKLDTSNIVALCPFNEPTEEYDHDQCVKDLRSIGYKGLIFGSNSMVQKKVVPGDLSDIHVYCGEDDMKVGEFVNHTYDVNSWTKNPLVVRQPRPIIATEVGHRYPSEHRRISEQNICDHLLSVGAQVICLFTFATRPEHWLASWKGVEIGNPLQFSGDPERLPTLEWLHHRMNNLPFLRNTHTKQVPFVRVEGERYLVTPTSVTSGLTL